MRKLHKKYHWFWQLQRSRLTGSLTVGSAVAYFTTYATAQGGVTMNMGFTETKPHEEVGRKRKTCHDFQCWRL